jgi:hypothetical protein
MLLRCSVVEAYMASNLDYKFHAYETICPAGDDLGSNCILGARRSDLITFDGLSVARAHSPLLKGQLDKVKVDLPRLVKFLLECEVNKDTTRDEVPSNNSTLKCMRLDLGCAGMSYESKPDKNDPMGRHAPSRIVCGKHFFAKNKAHGLAVRHDIGQLVDALCKTMDKMHERNKEKFPHKPFQNTARWKRYSRWLREYLGAKYMRCEWITIQLKSLNRGDKTKGHYDMLNCPQPGYNVTGALCFMFMDGLGEFWSLKILVNSRKNIGDHLIPDFPRLYAGMKRQVDAIDSRYDHLMNLQYSGELPKGLPTLTARNYRAMFLDDHMPWEKENLREKGDEGEPIYGYTFSVISGIQRDLFMSVIVSAIKMVEQEHSLGQDKLLELAITASYQNSFKRFFHIMSTELPTDFADYYEKTKAAFGSFRGGTEIRYSASGLDFEKVFMDGEVGRQRMDLAVAELKSLFQWMNTHTFKDDHGFDRSRKIITIEDFHRKVKQTLHALEFDPLIEKGMKMEIKEFRLLLIIQICALGGIYLDEHPILTKFMYVVEGTGGYKFLLEKEKSEEQEHGKSGTSPCQRTKKKVVYTVKQCKCIMDCLALALRIGEADRHNAMECIGCESQEARREDSVRDVYMLGQNLYTVNVDGRRFVKYYGHYMWVPMHPKHQKEQYTQPY